MSSVIAADSLTAGYGQVVAIRDIDLAAEAGEIVVLLGSNGAGKSTTLRTLAGALSPMSGSVRWLGRAINDSQYRRAAAGLRFIPERRAIFPTLNVRENLSVGPASNVGRALELFPELGPLLFRKAQMLSGGEQQMLVVARALSARPKALLADELSQGLAPLVVERLVTAICHAANAEGMAVILVEQQLRAALAFAQRGYVLQRGRVVLSGSSSELLARLPEIESAYLSRVGAAAAVPTGDSGKADQARRPAAESEDATPDEGGLTMIEESP